MKVTEAPEECDLAWKQRRASRGPRKGWEDNGRGEGCKKNQVFVGFVLFLGGKSKERKNICIGFVGSSQAFTV